MNAHPNHGFLFSLLCSFDICVCPSFSVLISLSSHVTTFVPPFFLFTFSLSLFNRYKTKRRKKKKRVERMEPSETLLCFLFDSIVSIDSIALHIRPSSLFPHCLSCFHSCFFSLFVDSWVVPSRSLTQTYSISLVWLTIAAFLISNSSSFFIPPLFVFFPRTTTLSAPYFIRLPFSFLISHSLLSSSSCALPSPLSLVLSRSLARSLSLSFSLSLCLSLSLACTPSS